MIRFIDPRGEIRTPLQPYELAYDLNKGDSQAAVGLLANGFPDSGNFLHFIGEALRKRFPGITVKAWNKGNASIAAPSDMLSEIQSECQIVIAAYGH